jgi:hypothetical protein
MKRPLGCFTPSGMIAGGISLVAIVSAAWITGNGIFSPGPLSVEAGEERGGVPSHSALSDDCGACHPPAWEDQRMTDLCLECHLEIQADLVDPAGLHGAIVGHYTCQACHTEHKGATARLTSYARVQYPHNDVGFSLQAHLEPLESDSDACLSCHAGTVRDFDVKSCWVCHLRVDQVFLGGHISTFGLDCLNCHDGLDTYGSHFDHQMLDFPLDGMHAAISCAACHAGVYTIEALQKTPHTCRACHGMDDPHQDEISNCGECHTPEHWQSVHFNHDLTLFPLEGGHLDAECLECHRLDRFLDIRSACISCHALADVHAGDMPECESCHASSSWGEIFFDHQLSDFPLTGAHLSVQCTGCHIDLRYRSTPSICGECHLEDDRHLGRFGQDCSACHATTTWSEVTFDHNLTAFPLTGAHASLACESCHRDFLFQDTPTFCSACHRDPAYHAGAFRSDCSACHSTSAWLPARFDLPHRFPMGHGGASGDCQSCHPSNLTAYNCYGCHAHSKSEVVKKHQEENISNLSNCVRCHPTGKEDGDD